VLHIIANETIIYVKDPDRKEKLGILAVYVWDDNIEVDIKTDCM
jgi:hypothetical protein